MSTVTVIRAGAADAFGDSLGVSEHQESGCKIGWSSAAQVNDSNGQVVELTKRSTTLYFRGRVPDIRDSDRVRLPNGDEYGVEGVNAWEHARFEGIIAGVEVVLEGAR